MSYALLDSWRKILRKKGQDRAVVEASTGQSATFNQLDQRAENWVASHAAELEKVAGRPVVFAVPNCIQWLDIFLGLLKVGAVVVPLDSTEPAASQQQLASRLRAAGWWNGQRIIPLSGSKRFRDPEVCLIKLTSGSTGQPKPLVFKARELLADARQVTAAMKIGPRDLNFALIPLGHSYGLGNLTLPLIAQGIPLILGTSPFPESIAQDFSQWKPTVFPGVPAIWRGLVASTVQLENLRLAISAGSALPPELAQSFSHRFGQKLHAFYGSSETGGISYDDLGQAALNGGVGSAVPGVSLSLSARGGLHVSSAAVFTHRNPHREKAHGSWPMADRVSLDGRGQLTILGRRGTTVKIAGRRLDLSEIISRIRQIPGVRDAWAGTNDAAEPTLGAAVVSERTVAELRAEMQRDMPNWKIPKRLHVLPALPLTARGKVDGNELKNRLFGKNS